MVEVHYHKTLLVGCLGEIAYRHDVLGGLEAVIAIYALAKGIIRYHSLQAALSIELCGPVGINYRCLGGITFDLLAGMKQ